MSSQAPLYLIAFGIGLVAAIYLPLNGRFAQQIGSPLLAVTIFFAVGAAASLLLFILSGMPGASSVGKANWPLYGLGIISCGIILGATVLIPKIGPAAYFICIISGEVLMAMTLSHFGILAPQRLPLTPLKAFGAVAIIAGVLLIQVEEGKQTIMSDLGRNGAKSIAR